MSNIINEAEAVAAPWLPIAKLAGIGAVALGLVGSGWWLHGAFDGTKVAKAETTIAKCEGARASDNAASNGAAAKALGASIPAAAAADNRTNSNSNKRAAGYATAQEEANHVPASNSVALCVDPEPLRQLLIGLRDADAGSAAGGAGADRLSGAAVH